MSKSNVSRAEFEAFFAGRPPADRAYGVELAEFITPEFVTFTDANWAILYATYATKAGGDAGCCGGKKKDMDAFKLESYCDSGSYCARCRELARGRPLRQNFFVNGLVEEIDFACPRGKDWGWQPPRIVNVALNILGGAVGYAKAKMGVDPAEDDKVRARLDVCAGCELAVPCKEGSPVLCCGETIKSLLDAGGGSCGCNLETKAALDGAVCPLGKWLPAEQE